MPLFLIVILLCTASGLAGGGAEFRFIEKAVVGFFIGLVIIVICAITGSASELLMPVGY